MNDRYKIKKLETSNLKQNSESAADTNNVDEGSEDIIDSKPPENEDLTALS